MSLSRAKEHLQKYGLENRIMEFSVSSASAVKLTLDELEKASNLKNG